MDQKRVTLVISDLHVGDGTAGDDFVDHKHQFATKALGHGDYHRGIIAAVAELTGIDCDKEHDNPNLTDAALKQCSPIWWPGMITPSEK